MAIPERFLPRVMSDLVRAGLVVGRRGRTGGYRLARPASAISLLEIIGAADPEPEIRRCILRGVPCGIVGKCDVHDAFMDARGAMLARLGDTTLSAISKPDRSDGP
jgi:Rrf2 family protein